MNIKLNPQQLEATQQTEGPLLILAGAGTGKTRVITQRIAHIINNGITMPDRVMAVTFTNKAANEMLARISDIADIRGIWVGTFHSLATKIIRVHTEALKLSKEFIIIDVDDQWKLLNKILKEMNYSDKEYPIKKVAGMIGRWKDLGLFPEDLSASDLTSSSQRSIKSVYIEYQKRLKQFGSLDFGDLLLYCIKLFKDFPEILNYYQEKFHYVMVDEYQDTNAIQYLWLRYLSQKHKNICAVGDEDQSIYSWRGAEIRNIMKFTHDFPGAKIIRLEQNYRSSQNILSTANQLISNNKTRIGKNLWTEIESEERVRIIIGENSYKEADRIAQEIKKLSDIISRQEIAILVRASFQTRIIEEVLIQYKIPYKIFGGLKFYERMEVKNALAYIKLSYNLDDSLSFERIINTPKRGVGLTTIKQIQEYANIHQCSYFRSAQLMILNQYFKGKTYSGLLEFIERAERWNKLFANYSVHEASKIIIEESGYIDSLRLENTLESESRIENIEELLKNIAEFPSIIEFLEHISLVNEMENKEENDVVKIMTMHAAKGLEFEAVFLPGWEEGIFPSKMSIEQDNLEEERRLAYVAMTRAKRKLYILHANSRLMYGTWQYNRQSIFLDEILSLPSVIRDNGNNLSFKYEKMSSFGNQDNRKNNEAIIGIKKMSHA
ncbi:MAG: UvrD-helicase domain-containing protein, partial [Pseudomonadota bacterium]